MKRSVLKVLLILFSALLITELIFLGVMTFRDQNGPAEDSTDLIITGAPVTLPGETEATLPETTAAPTETVPTEEPTEAETQPRELRYTLTFAGDCTLASDAGSYNAAAGFIQTIGTDYGYPFRNVLEYFENDDFTIINLESVLADEGLSANKLFTFRGPTAYTEIMTGSSVEAVTLANNHTADYGKAGYESTTKALTDAGVWFVEEDKTTIVTTESGLVIGLYADSFDLDAKDIEKNVKFLREQGAEIVICAFHWGTEGSYRPTGSQKQFARAAIDAGADIVYGHHPHVLQPIEEYNGGYICYSLGNFSFGGNHFPRDLDSALVQLTVIRDENGEISLGELTLIPLSISSIPRQNNFQPTPYKEGTAEYDRAMSKLDGTFTGPDLVVNYDHLKPTDSTTPPQQDGDTATEPGGSGDAVTPPPTQSGGETPPPADGGGETPPPADGGGENPPPADPPADSV